MYLQEMIEKALVRFNSYKNTRNSDNPHNLNELMTFFVDELRKVSPNAVLTIASDKSFLLHLKATEENWNKNPHQAFVVPIAETSKNGDLDVMIGFALISVIEYIVANRMPHDPVTFWYCPDALRLNLCQISKETVSSWDLLCTLNSECVQVISDEVNIQEPQDDLKVGDIPGFCRAVISMIDR